MIGRPANKPRKESARLRWSHWSSTGIGLPWGSAAPCQSQAAENISQD